MYKRLPVMKDFHRGEKNECSNPKCDFRFILVHATVSYANGGGLPFPGTAFSKDTCNETGICNYCISQPEISSVDI